MRDLLRASVRHSVRFESNAPPLTFLGLNGEGAVVTQVDVHSQQLPQKSIPPHAPLVVAKASPVRTWVTQSKAALKSKTVCLFQTHGGGGMERVGKAFAEVIGDAAKVLPPKAFAGSSIKSSVAALEAFVTERCVLRSSNPVPSSSR